MKIQIAGVRDKIFNFFYVTAHCRISDLIKATSERRTVTDGAVVKVHGF